MSSRIAVEQRRYAAGMVDTQGWQFEICGTSLLLSSRCNLNMKRFRLRITVKRWRQRLRKQVKKNPKLMDNVIWTSTGRLMFCRETNPQLKWVKLKQQEEWDIQFNRSGYFKLFSFKSIVHIFRTWFLNIIEDKSTRKYYGNN